MPGFQIIGEPISAERGYGNIGASQIFDQGDPVMFTSGLLVTAPVDGTELILTDDIAGFAIDPAEGLRAASRPVDSGTAALAAGFNGPTQRTYARIDSGIRLRTRNFWATAAAGTAEPIVAADIGLHRQMSAVNTAGGAWGVEDTAAAIGTDYIARLIEPQNADGLPLGQYGGTGTFWTFTVEVA
jgi:hypothetical protein